jgi:capsular polysaccharide biosynthesis protein
MQNYSPHNKKREGEKRLSYPKHSTYIADDDIEIDLRQILAVLKKWRKLIIVMTLFCAMSSAIISCFILEPVYQAETLLMVNRATEKIQAIQQPASQNDLDNVVSTVSNIRSLP